jgi:predicted DNA-binding transcriptional regulator AlpA
MATRYLRKTGVAARYGCTVRTLERKIAQGIVPKPIYLGNRFPLWAESELEDAERRALAERTAQA